MNLDFFIGLLIIAFVGFLIYRFVKRAGTFVMWIKGSLETDGRASARKISAFIVMFLVVIAHGAWLKRAFLVDDFSLLAQVLVIDFGFVALCLGLKTAETIFTKRKEDQPPSA